MVKIYKETSNEPGGSDAQNCFQIREKHQKSNNKQKINKDGYG